MKRKRRYRLYVRLMILSGAVLAVTLSIISFKLVRADKNFTKVILEENNTFLVNTLRFGHAIMLHTGTENYEGLIDLALKSKIIRYLAILDQDGKLIAQSNAQDPPISLQEYDPNLFSDGAILGEREDILLVSYRSREIMNAAEHEMHQMSFKSRVRALPEPGWLLVGLDTSYFKKHHRDWVVQTVVVGATFFLLGTSIIVFLGIVQRYELVHLSIEKLNKIKRVLAKFVPVTAKRIIENDPERALLDRYIQDATVFFLDIEEFTTLVEKYPQEKINWAIESYFSRFLECIQKNEGDINETAGDGIMVIFLHPDPVRHARNAVQTALEIHKKCIEMSENGDSDLFPIKVNIGISTGNVYLGSTKMRSTGGDRWTFTASGALTILAARLSDYGQGGQVLISEETARRVDGDVTLKSLGRVPLKNLRDSGEVYQVST